MPYTFSFSPFMKTPLTDLVATTWTSQEYGRCYEFEMKLTNCMEAYGVDRGEVKCKDIYDDFMECSTNYKQKCRYYAMSDERLRQYKAGERAKDNLYEPEPTVDSFIAP